MWQWGTVCPAEAPALMPTLNAATVLSCCRIADRIWCSSCCTARSSEVNKSKLSATCRLEMINVCRGCDREAIPDHEREGIFRNHAFRCDLAERASDLFLGVQDADVPEVRVITCSLVGITQPTEGLEILERVGPSRLAPGMMWSTSSARSSAGTPHNSHLKPARFSVSYRSLPGI